MFTCGIILHELGHLFGGLISGYRFLNIEIFGFSIEKIGGRLRLRFYRHVPVGQCLMYPDNIEKNGYLLIIGGIVMNLFAGVICFILCICLKFFWGKILLTIFGVVNLSLVFMNVFGSATCDGRTFLETIKDYDNMKAYNTLMIIYRYLKEGRSYRDMPEFLFQSGRVASIVPNAECLTLKKELEMHTERYLMEERR